MQIQATGADELLIAMQTPNSFGLGTPAILWGKPGTGKTSFVESLASVKLPVVTLVASLFDPTDFSGLPFFQDGRTRFAPPEWAFEFDETENGLLFIDEITTCPPAVQASLLRVILHRRVGSKSLPERVRIVAAANPPDEIHGGYELTPPLANRFCHIQWDMPVGVFANAMHDGFGVPELTEIDPVDHRSSMKRWQALIGAFLQRNSAMLHTRPSEGEQAFASPRTYEMAAGLMASCELLGIAPGLGRSDALEGECLSFLRLVMGCIGTAATTSFLGFLRNLDLPNPSEFLAGKALVEVGKMQDDALFVFFGSLVTLLERRRNLKSKSGSKRAIAESVRVLELIGAVCKSGKLDSAFAPIVKLLKTNWLQDALLHASRCDDQRLKANLGRAMHCLESTELAQYIALVAHSSSSES